MRNWKSLATKFTEANSILGQENPVKKEMATHSSVFAWEISSIEEPSRLQSMGLQESDAA